MDSENNELVCAVREMKEKAKREGKLFAEDMDHLEFGPFCIPRKHFLLVHDLLGAICNVGVSASQEEGAKANGIEPEVLVGLITLKLANDMGEWGKAHSEEVEEMLVSAAMEMGAEADKKRKVRKDPSDFMYS